MRGSQLPWRERDKGGVGVVTGRVCTVRRREGGREAVGIGR